MEMDLFGNIKLSDREITQERVKSINGLQIFPDFITKEKEQELLRCIDESTWLNDLSRRVQHYGYKYDYKARKIDRSFFIGQFPEWLSLLAKDVQINKYINFMPDQAIVNEYQIGQGIAPHIDCEPCFGDTIISLSLGSNCIMNFEKLPNSKERVELLLESRSLLIMTGESRFNWFHSISPRKNDSFNNKPIKRARRVSITFRKVILTN